MADPQAVGGTSAEGAWSPLDEVRHLSISGLFLTARGGSTDAILARLEALSAEVPDAFAVSSVRGLRSARAFLLGDYRLAGDEALGAAEDDNVSALYLAFALRAAAWSGDVERTREIADLLDANRASDRFVKADRIAARAAIAALEGRIDEAVAGFRDALARHRAVGADYWTALRALDFVLLVGADHPATREAAAEARGILERVGARPYLAKLEQAMATDGPVGGRSPMAHATAVADA